MLLVAVRKTVTAISMNVHHPFHLLHALHTPRWLQVTLSVPSSEPHSAVRRNCWRRKPELPRRCGWKFGSTSSVAPNGVHRRRTS